MVPLEREHELEVLGGVVATGGVVLVEGPAGIGKTALLGAVSAPRVLRARGAPLEGDFAFGVVRQLLGDVDPAALTGPAAPAASLFGGAAADAYDVLHALAVVVERLAPVVLVVDDAHWADEASLRFLVFLAHRARSIGAALVVGARPAAEWDAPAWHAALVADPEVVVLRPAPLSAQAAVALAPADPEHARACHAASGGNPFYLHELLRAGTDTGAALDRVRRSVRARLERLGPDAEALARALSVLAEGTPLRTVAALADTGTAGAATAADALREVGILAAGPALAFAHPVLRTVVSELDGPAARAAAHGRAADLLRADGAAPDVVAAQLLVAEPAGDPARVDVLVEAARDAMARSDADAAVVLLRRALAEPPAPGQRAGVLLALGLAEAHHRDPAAREHLVAAIDGLDDPDARLHAAVALWTTDSFDGRYDEGMAVLERVLAGAHDADPDRLLRVELEVARGLRSALATAARGRERIAALRGRPEPLAQALVLLDDLLAGAPAGDLADRALAAVAPVDVSRGGPLSHIPYYVLVYCDRLAQARTLLDVLIADAQARGARLGADIGILWRGLAHLRAGDLAAAEADVRTVIAGAAESRWRFGAVAARHFLVEVLLERGELEEARRLTPPADAGVAARGWTTHVRFGRARVALACGDAKGALADLLEVGRLEQAFLAERPTMLPWRSEAALAGGPPQLAAEEVAIARRIGAPRALGVALRAHGVVTGDLARLAEAVDVLATSEARLEHGRALVDLGAAVRRANRRVEAREHLRAGLDLAVRAGATALADRARDELRASGARLRRDHAGGIEGLTPSELRVARMAAGGASNPDIAQALFVSRKTVEKHLAGAYAKLGIASRSELADALDA